MKYKVIGWTYQENYDLENAPLTFASRHAIVDEIKKHGYLFSGYEHQEYHYGCPVLNDGKKRMLSQRGFAGIMAEAHGELEPYSYAKYMFGINKEALVTPKAFIDETKILTESELLERFSLSVSQEIFYLASENKEITLDDLEELRYVDKGDVITLSFGGSAVDFTVFDVDRRRIQKENKTILTIKLKNE